MFVVVPIYDVVVMCTGNKSSSSNVDVENAVDEVNTSEISATKDNSSSSKARNVDSVPSPDNVSKENVNDRNKNGSTSLFNTQ